MRIEYRIGLAILLIVVGLFFVQFAIEYLAPFLLAVVMAILIEPVVNFFEKRVHLNRGIAVALVLLLVLLLFAVFLVAGVAQVYVELEKLSKNFPSYQTILEKYQWIMRQNEELENLLNRWSLSEGQQMAIDKLFQDIYAFITSNFRIFVSQLLGLLAKLPKLITIFIISFIATFFISRDRRAFSRAFWRLIPQKWQKKLRMVKDEVTKAAFRFIRAELILISITTIISIVGLEILNSEYALLIGFMAGLLDLIPVIGPTLIFIPWAIYSMIAGSFGFGIGLLIIYGVMAVTRQLAEAKIIGESIGVHPLAALISMYVGLKLFGVSGVILGPAAVIVLKALIKAGIITLNVTKKE